MPFTRDPLEYPINRLLLRVGMALQIYWVSLPPIRDRAERPAWEKEQARLLGLDQAVADGLIVRYLFLWNRWTGELRTVRLIPHPRHRRTPGIKRLKQLFFTRSL